MFSKQRELSELLFSFHLFFKNNIHSEISQQASKALQEVIKLTAESTKTNDFNLIRSSEFNLPIAEIKSLASVSAIEDKMLLITLAQTIEQYQVVLARLEKTINSLLVFTKK